MGCRTTLTKYSRQKCFLQTKLFLFFVCFTRIALGTLRTDSYLSFAIGRKVRSGDKSIARSFLLIKKNSTTNTLNVFSANVLLNTIKCNAIFLRHKNEKKKLFSDDGVLVFFRMSVRLLLALVDSILFVVIEHDPATHPPSHTRCFEGRARKLKHGGLVKCSTSFYWQQQKTFLVR